MDKRKKRIRRKSGKKERVVKKRSLRGMCSSLQCGVMLRISSITPLHKRDQAKG